MLNRKEALEAAVKIVAGKSLDKKVISQLEKLSYRFEAFITKGEFDAEVAPDVPVAPEAPVAQVDNTQVNDAPPVGDAPQDDDIPF
jgi:hypothetical protein